jgi:DNA-binding transcriptional MerR regulator
LTNATVNCHYSPVQQQDARYGIAELAQLGGVSRRTVRYYVQEGLLPAPFGVGRGQHYGTAHLERLLEVKRLQQIGRALDEIRRELRGEPVRAAERRQAASVRHSVWRRLMLMPGVELHVAAAVPLPPAGQLDELTRALRRAFVSASHGQEDGDA